jgi:hypothetical protein
MQAAYLALTQLLDYNHELVLLLVNTLLSDLKSDNYVVVCSALVVTTKLIGPDLINAGRSCALQQMHLWLNAHQPVASYRVKLKLSSAASDVLLCSVEGS